MLDEKEIEELGEALRSYQHVRFLSIQKNQLKDISEVLHIPHLLTLNASENQVASIDFLTGARDSLLYVQQLTLTKNKLVALPSLPLPRLAKLLINENEIASCAAFAGHACLQYLDLSKNKLTTLEGVSKMPKLQHLDVSENELTEVRDGLHGLPDLRKLILTKNKIASLAGFANMFKLEHLVLIENQITTAKELLHLNKAVPSLKQLDMMENPAAADNFKTEVLIIQSESSIIMRKLNDEDITDEDRQAAATTKADRLKAEEDARKAEEEARKEAEAKAMAGDATIPEAADE